MEILKLLDKYKGVYQGRAQNQYQARPVYFNFNDSDVNEFNNIYLSCLDSNLNTIIRSEGKGKSIRKGNKYLSNNYAWDVTHNQLGARITVLYKGNTYVFKIGNLKETDFVKAPIQCWFEFGATLLDYGININDYAISEEDGLKAKEEILDPLIFMNYHMKATDPAYTNVHHIDFHNSYPAGLANTHPEFKPALEYMYSKRKQDETYKAILNFSIGCMQSKKSPWNARWAGIARDAINDNVHRLIVLINELENSGRKILGCNTDGIWYQGDVFHGIGEGDKLGEWHNDHIDCSFRSKSDGCYEFIENGQYYPIVRGKTNLDIIEPDRSKWVWGDIFNRANQIKVFCWEDGKGITSYEEK